ncbi:hypothetical protein [Nocardioides psychrotolerans]|uniref:hypothetical protein n=1 Tax=Nocardioides psychrotolerans TaxID=1005945 RepID=UPI0031377842
MAEKVSRVYALGGDDAVCVTGRSRIEAGDGNDRVQSQSPVRTKTVVVLGSGSDLFEGSLGQDVVFAEQTSPNEFTGEPESSPGTGTENTDVVRTYGGADEVFSGAREDSQVNQDEVHLGGGADRVSVVTWRGGEVLVSGSTGTDEFSYSSGDALAEAVAISIDLTAGTAIADGVRFATVEGFEDVDVIHTSAAPGSSLEVRGNGGRNTIDATAYRVDTVSIKTGAGRDWVDASNSGGRSISVVTGDDNDVVFAGADSVSVQTGDGDDSASLYARGIADSPGGVSFDGGDGADDLEVTGVLESVLGGDGYDSVKVNRYSDDEDKPALFDLANGIFTRGDQTAAFETERLVVHAYDGEKYAAATILGSEGSDKIIVSGCGSVVRGAGGNDALISRTGECIGDEPLLYGDSGDDFLQGAHYRDVLRGGAGYDRAFGGPGSDLCRAEFKRECERY